MTDLTSTPAKEKFPRKHDRINRFYVSKYARITFKLYMTNPVINSCGTIGSSDDVPGSLQMDCKVIQEAKFDLRVKVYKIVPSKLLS